MHFSWPPTAHKCIDALVQVNSIDYRQASVVVTDTTGTKWTAKRVLCTVPLGVLKTNTISFVPGLPAAQQTAIRRLGMGVLDKVGDHRPS
jgi:monoamine oxidase